MSRRGPIVNTLILLATAGFLSACNAHYNSGGTVYRPHEGAVRTGPVRTRTAIVTPRRDRHDYVYYRRDRHGRYHRDRNGGYYRDRGGRYLWDREARYRRDRHGRYHRDRNGGYNRKRDGRYSRNRDGRYSRNRDDRNSRNRDDRNSRDRDDRNSRDRDDRNSRDRDDRNSRDQRNPRREQPNVPTTAKQPNPPAHGLYGTQPGRLKPQTGPKRPVKSAVRDAMGKTRKPALLDSQNRRAPKQPSSVLKRQAKPPKPSILKHEPRKKSGLLKGKQRDAKDRKDDSSDS